MIILILLLIISLIVTPANFSISPFDAFACHKYCNESYAWKARCSSSDLLCSKYTIKCKSSNVYVNKRNYCKDKDGFLVKCKTKVCEVR